jgi:alpha-glucoside transport system substrate-binding protein
MRGRSAFRRLTMAALLAGCVAGTGACAGGGSAVTLTVIGNWTGQEADAFNRVLSEFERETGIHVVYTGSQSLNRELQADVRLDHPPDVAMVASLGQLAAYADEGALKPFPLTTAQTQVYHQAWLGWAQDLRPRVSDPNQWYAIPFKVDLGSLVWYNPLAVRKLPGPLWTPPVDGDPHGWDKLSQLEARIVAQGGTPWCVGMASPPNSGWPGTEWIADILLHQSGSRAYQEWTNGTLPWSSPQVRQAWATWGSLVTAGFSGGIQAMLATGFDSAGQPMFDSTPGCYLDHKGGFVMGFYQSNAAQDHRPLPQPNVDYGFFPFPSINGQGNSTDLVSADFAAMFRDSPQARQLIQFLASDTAQRIWPGIAAAAAFSADVRVPPSVYSDDVKRQIATMLINDTLCFNAEDLMPAPMSSAFNQAVLAYLNRPDSDELNLLTNQLDEVSAQASWIRPNGLFQCGR